MHVSTPMRAECSMFRSGNVPWKGLSSCAGTGSRLAQRASLGHTGTSSGEGSGGPCCCKLRDERLNVPDPDFLRRGIVPRVYSYPPRVWEVPESTRAGGDRPACGWEKWLPGSGQRNRWVSLWRLVDGGWLLGPRWAHYLLAGM